MGVFTDSASVTHRTNGGPANLGACRNGVARPSQANIPAGDRDGVRRHLQAHLSDAPGAEDHVRLLDLDHVHDLSVRLRNLAGGVRKPHLEEGRSWYRVRNESDLAEIYLYDSIGGWGITASEFIADLNQIVSPDIHLRVNCEGGEVYDGLAIYEALCRHPSQVTVHVDALAASAASYVAMAGDRVLMARNARMMIHDAIGMCMGPPASMREVADLLDDASDNIATIYADRTKKSPAYWRAKMNATSWFTADTAVSEGLADGIETHPARPADGTENHSSGFGGYDFAQLGRILREASHA